MRPTASKFTNPSGIIDKRIGEHFEAVDYVSKNLDKVAHLSYYMESLFNLDRNLSLLTDENVEHHILKDITIFQGPSAYELALKVDYAIFCAVCSEGQSVQRSNIIRRHSLKIDNISFCIICSNADSIQRCRVVCCDGSRSQRVRMITVNG